MGGTSVIGVSICIRFITEEEAKRYKRRLINLLNTPCMIVEDTVYVVAEKSDFEAVWLLARQFLLVETRS